LAGPVRTVILTLALIALALPQVNILNALTVAFGIFAPDTTCPTTPIIQTSSTSYFYHCLNHDYWSKHWVLPETYRSLATVWGAILAVSFCLLWAWLLQVAKASLSTAGDGVEAGRCLVE
jgi:hypothetical protein